MVVSPLPIAVRRSTASTSESRAGTSGFPDRSMRRNTMPCPAGAGRNVASVRAPVCSRVPETAALCLMLRLVLGAIGPLQECLELVHDLRQPVQRALGPQKLAVVARRIPRHRGACVDVPDHPSLYRDARAAPDRHVVGEAGLARQEDVVFDMGAARDSRLTRDQTAGSDAAVVADLAAGVDLRPRPRRSTPPGATVARRHPAGRRPPARTPRRSARCAPVARGDPAPRTGRSPRAPATPPPRRSRRSGGSPAPRLAQDRAPE